MSVKRTEVGVRDQLIKELKKQLGKKFYIAEECSIKHKEHFIKWKGRNQPDILIFNKELIILEKEIIKFDDSRAIVAIIDTKKFNEDITKDDHIGQLYRYMVDLNVNHGFLTNYQDVASHHLTVKRLRRKSSFTNSEEVVKWIVECINESYSQIPKQFSVEKIIEILDYSMEQLISYTKLVEFEKWEEILRISDLEDENLYINEAEKIDARYRGAAFVALSQLLFYIILRTTRIKLKQNFSPSLNRLILSNGIPDQIQNLLDNIREKINYNAIYQYRIFPFLPDSANNTLKEIIESLEGLSNELVIQHDLIGLLFQRLIPFDLRKKLAAYYSKPLAAELLTRLIFKTGDETVLDPACGSGTLLVHSYLQKKRIKGINAKHKKILSEIAGSNISVFATILTSVNLAIQDPGKWTDKVNIFNENSFNLPRAQIERFLADTIFVRTVKKQTTNGLEFIERPGLVTDIVLANPPFTKGSRLTTKEKKSITSLIESYHLKPRWDTWNLYSCFILLAPMFLKPKEQGRIGLILPHSSLSSSYMEKVWDALFEHTGLRIKYIINASMEDISFSDSSEQEIIVIMEKFYKQPVKLIQIKNSLKEIDIEELALKISNINQPNFNLDMFEGRMIEQEEFISLQSRQWKFTSTGLLQLIQRDFIKIEKKEKTLQNMLKIGSDSGAKPVDYFWIPNKFWNLKTKDNDFIYLEQTNEVKKFVNEFIKNENDKKRLNSLFRKSEIPKIIKIHKNYLTKSLPRKIRDLDEYYSYFKDGLFFTYFINYRKLSKDLNEDYYKWAEILKLKTKTWVSGSPRPASIFIPSKIRLNTTKSLAYYSPNLFETSRLMSIIFIPSNKSESVKEYSEILFSYLSSSIFFLDYIENSRIMSGAYRRSQLTDFVKIFKFPNIASLKKGDKDVLRNASILYNKNLIIKERYPLQGSIGDARINKDSLLRKLDEAWFAALNLPLQTLDLLYSEILEKIIKTK